MINSLILMMCLLLCGCMSAEQVRMMQEQAQEQSRINTNIQNAVLQKPNLMGFSAQQIAQQFGSTSEVSTTYNAQGTQQDEKYSYVDANSTKYEFDVSIENGLVTSVQYFPPYTLPPPPTVVVQAPADDPQADLANTIKQEQDRKEEAYQKQLDAQLHQVAAQPPPAPIVPAYVPPPQPQVNQQAEHNQAMQAAADFQTCLNNAHSAGEVNNCNAAFTKNR